jgi:hypothetical protein
MKNMKNKLLIATLFIFSVSFFGCTDLHETFYDEITPSQADPGALLDGLYGTLRGYADTNLNYGAAEYVYFVQMSTDELCVPVRKGGDWYDGGQYIEMQNHTWTPANKIVLAAWRYCYNIISNCNAELNQTTMGFGVNAKAEIRVIRAYAYYRLLDMFGNVPLITEKNSNEVHAPANSSRQVIYNFVLSELTDPTVVSNLPNKKYGRMSVDVVNTLLARLYLNAEVFTGTAHWQDCIDACEAVRNSGRYSLETNPYNNFNVDNGPTSKEIILAIPFDGITTVGNYLQMLSYDSYQGTAFSATIFGNCVNGPCVNPVGTYTGGPGEYDIFQPAVEGGTTASNKADIRRLAMLTGQQYNPGTGKALVHLGDSINYAPNFTGGFVAAAATNASLAAKRGDGARIIKYELVSNQNWEMANDWVVMRYAEVLYMEAECYIRLGQPANAYGFLHDVLVSRGYDPTASVTNPMTSAVWMSKRGITPTDLSGIIPANITIEFMDQELRREFIFEDHRRTDMIRMGKYLGVWGLKPIPDLDNHTLIFPIPTAVLAVEPNLVQNPGY